MAGESERAAVNPRESWRLTFHFDGESVQLRRRERVPMVAPAAVGERPRGAKHSGAWVEILDQRGAVLHHRLVHDPFRVRAEHHSPDGRIEVHIRPPQQTDFEVVVPALAQADSVRLWATPPDEEERHGPARDQGRFPLYDREE
ncbi:hypothetical protein [Streptomyces sp. NPDC002845]